MLDVPPAELPSDGTVAVAAAAPVALECAPPSPYSLLYLASTDCDRHSGGYRFGSLKDEPSIEDGLDEGAAVTSAAAAPAAGGCEQGGAGWARFQIAMFLLGWICPPCRFAAAAAYPCLIRRDGALITREALWWRRNFILSLIFALELLVFALLLLCNALPLNPSHHAAAPAAEAPSIAASSPPLPLSMAP